MNLNVAWERVRAGQALEFEPRGNSMAGLIESGQLVKVVPCLRERLEVDDIVLVKVKGNVYLHRIRAVQGRRFLIGNNRDGINGWTRSLNVAGLCVEVAGRPRPRVAGKY